MTRFRLITTWLLLLIPTLLLGIGALYLLKGEEDRLERSARATARDRISAIAGNIDLAVAEVKDGLVETLRGLPQGGILRQTDLLEDWKRGNPLVRNVFVWEGGRGLRYPDPEMPSSDEEADFIRRYLPLFADQAAWQAPPDDSRGAASEDMASSILLERRELRQLAKQAPIASEASADRAAAPGAGLAGAPGAGLAGAAIGASGWRPWFADNRLHLLGWYETDGGSRRIGFEVEMMALLSRLLGNFPPDAPYGETIALIDGNGDIFHQVGPLEISADSRPLAAASVASLPHWMVTAYPNADGGRSGTGFLLISSLLVGTFVVAILLGGSLLLWQAHRNQVDARQKTSFVSNVSHELKTPLTTIRMYAEMLGEKRIEDAGRQQSYLRTIIRESQRLTRLVNNVLDFSRLEQGRKAFAKEEIALPSLLHELLDSQQVRLEDAGMQLIREVDAAVAPIESDRDALEQIVLNLVDNAIKYAAEGKSLTVELQQQKGGPVVRFKDDGPGIPAGHRGRIFDKFHRVDASLTARQQGSGLGLSIARQLAEGLGGSLSFCPNTGGGCCFELTLPARSDR
ncbi:HAMP domain-containing sensor histidine kinase [Desulfuromonas sp.]|nr:HAMP domain-containing sensor histidine kinase [Desulfuromonas sp.]